MDQEPGRTPGRRSIRCVTVSPILEESLTFLVSHQMWDTNKLRVFSSCCVPKCSPKNMAVCGAALFSCPPPSQSFLTHTHPVRPTGTWPQQPPHSTTYSPSTRGAYRVGQEHAPRHHTHRRVPTKAHNRTYMVGQEPDRILIAYHIPWLSQTHATDIECTRNLAAPPPPHTPPLTYNRTHGAHTVYKNMTVPAEWPQPMVAGTIADSCAEHVAEMIADIFADL